jgi:periplasmic protein CpxP/Spy
MKMLKVLMIGAALSFGMSTVYAQEATEKTPEERAANQTAQMTESLSLTPDQQAKVAEINLGVALKNDAVRKNASMTPEQKKEAIQGNNEGRKASLKTVLTAEQYTKMEAQVEQRKANQQMKKEKIKAKRKIAPAVEPVKE